MALDEETKQRIEEEERFRAKVRAKAETELTESTQAGKGVVAPRKSHLGCLVVLLCVLLALFALMIHSAVRKQARESDKAYRSPSTQSARRLPKEKHEAWATDMQTALTNVPRDPSPAVIKSNVERDDKPQAEEEYRHILGVSARDAIEAVTRRGFRVEKSGRSFFPPDSAMQWDMILKKSLPEPACELGALVYLTANPARDDSRVVNVTFGIYLDRRVRSHQLAKAKDVLGLAALDMAHFLNAFTGGSVDPDEAKVAFELLLGHPPALDEPETTIRTRVVIASVEPGGMAERIGIQPGDILVSCAEREITSPAMLARTRDLQEHAILPLVLRRDGAELTIDVPFGPIGATYAYTPTANVSRAISGNLIVKAYAESM